MGIWRSWEKWSNFFFFLYSSFCIGATILYILLVHSIGTSNREYILQNLPWVMDIKFFLFHSRRSMIASFFPLLILLDTLSFFAFPPPSTPKKRHYPQERRDRRLLFFIFFFLPSFLPSFVYLFICLVLLFLTKT